MKCSSNEQSIINIDIDKHRIKVNHILKQVNEFVKKIIVHEADKSSGHRRQTVEIVFNFVGQIEIPILTEPITLEASPKQRKTA